MGCNLEWLVFCNGAPLPIAGFAWRDQAEEWANENYPGVSEIRHNTSAGIKPMQSTDRTDTTEAQR